jgi:hypothetical protein
MTVRAHHLTLLDLLEDAGPGPIRQRLADTERLRLGIEVIELEHDGILFSEVRAGMAGEEFEQVSSPLEP